MRMGPGEGCTLKPVLNAVIKHPRVDSVSRGQLVTDTQQLLSLDLYKAQLQVSAGGVAMGACNSSREWQACCSGLITAVLVYWVQLLHTHAQVDSLPCFCCTALHLSGHVAVVTCMLGPCQLYQPQAT
jgi:hypothetical protein